MLFLFHSSNEQRNITDNSVPKHDFNAVPKKRHTSGQCERRRRRAEQKKNTNDDDKTKFSFVRDTDWALRTSASVCKTCSFCVHILVLVRALRYARTTCFHILKSLMLNNNNFDKIYSPRVRERESALKFHLIPSFFLLVFHRSVILIFVSFKCAFVWQCSQSKIYYSFQSAATDGLGLIVVFVIICFFFLESIISFWFVCLLSHFACFHAFTEEGRTVNKAKKRVYTLLSSAHLPWFAATANGKWRCCQLPQVMNEIFVLNLHHSPIWKPKSKNSWNLPFFQLKCPII